MTLPPDNEDTSKALYSDGSWYILHSDAWANTISGMKYPHQSVIYHQCRNHWKQLANSQIYTPPVQYRVSVAELNIPCRSCYEICPEALQGLWILHNFDSIQSTTLDSSIPCYKS